MRVVWLARFICGVCLLLAFLATAVTYHPSARHLGLLLPPMFAALALLAAAAAVGLGRLPASHWVHRSKLLWPILVTIAVGAAVFFGVLV